MRLFTTVSIGENYVKVKSQKGDNLFIEAYY